MTDRYANIPENAQADIVAALRYAPEQETKRIGRLIELLRPHDGVVSVLLSKDHCEACATFLAGYPTPAVAALARFFRSVGKVK